MALASTPKVVLGAAALSNMGMFVAAMSSDSFPLLGMAERGMLPEFFAKRSRYGTPIMGILFSASGSYGEVYRAEWNGTVGNIAAIKVPMSLSYVGSSGGLCLLGRTTLACKPPPPRCTKLPEKQRSCCKNSEGISWIGWCNTDSDLCCDTCSRSGLQY